ncbi:hypothetical protein O181_026104 [Austropuccinia psidii MF-1]|uniref:RNB domain-containing protein n=1 Tax=Austropuccinia psidii MF-1 TaxID=1389203 RepID=A0A9Q3CJC0_9BASI|nr:hypothetical protein [Austropuccinia psidii MF-1]
MLKKSLRRRHLLGYSTHRSGAESANNQNEWNSFLSVSKQLIDCYGTFYNRSTSLQSSQKWEQLKSEGYRPVRHSKHDFRWWEEERKRGRIQPDHEPSIPLQRSLNDNHIKSQRAKSSAGFSAPQTRQFNTFASIAKEASSPFNHGTPRVIRKNSPDIMDVLGDAATFQIPDLEYTTLDSDSNSLSILSTQLGASPGAKGIRGLKPGSFLELRRTNQSEAGILVRVQGNGVIYVSRSGEIRLSILDNVMYIMHNVVPEDVASKAFDEDFAMEGLNDTVTSIRSPEISSDVLSTHGEILSSARKYCCHALRALEIRADHCHSILTQAGSYNLYERFKNPDPSKPGHLSSEQGVRYLLGLKHAENDIMVFALHQQLMANADMFLAITREMRDDSSFLVQSLNTLDALCTVRDWMTHDSVQLNSFVDKCKAIIESHRRTLKAENADSPLNIISNGFSAWTQTDLMFIEVLRTIAINQRMIQEQPYGTIVAKILKMIGLYDSEAMSETWPSLTFDRFGAIALLRDLGILPAWQSVGLWDSDLNLTNRVAEQFNIVTKSLDQSSQARASFLTKSLSTLPGTSQNPSLTQMKIDILPKDPIDSLRYDFGDLPVYIIDDPGAQELDDGISIEPIDVPPSQNGSSDDGHAWIHVHVADPTSCLDPSHPISLRACSYLDTLYLPGFSLPMLPSKLIKTHRMTLGSDDKFAKPLPQKTLSFSAKINQKGDILDYKVRPGWIKNTKQVTYKVVSEVLDGSKSSGRRVIHIGPDAEQKFELELNTHRNLSIDELEPKDRLHLQQLGQFAKILTKRRVDDGAMGWHLPIANVSICSDPSAWPSLGIPAIPHIATGTPSLSIILPDKIENLKNHAWGMNSAQALVTEMMLMAGRLAGRFYVDHHLHDQNFLLPFRSQPSPALIDSSQNEETLRELRKHINPNTGLISPFHFQKARIMFMPAVNGMDPMSHFPLGINDQYGYCKVTSPLRRYSDLVSHWQIKNTILRREGKATYEDKCKILSLKGMRDLIDRLDRDNKPFVTLSRKMNLSWVSYILRRLLSKEQRTKVENELETMDMLENGLTAVILQDPVLMRFTNRWSMKSYVPELGLRASLVVDEAQDWFAKWVHADDGKKLEDDPVGLKVPVKIAFINQEDHIVLRIDQTRFNTLETTVPDFAWKGTPSQFF